MEQSHSQTKFYLSIYLYVQVLIPCWTLGNTLLHVLVSAAEIVSFMIQRLSGTTAIWRGVQDSLRMNMILSNFELSNGSG